MKECECECESLWECWVRVPRGHSVSVAAALTARPSVRPVFEPALLASPRSRSRSRDRRRTCTSMECSLTCKPPHMHTPTSSTQHPTRFRTRNPRPSTIHNWHNLLTNRLLFWIKYRLKKWKNFPRLEKNLPLITIIIIAKRVFFPPFVQFLEIDRSYYYYYYCD